MTYTGSRASVPETDFSRHVKQSRQDSLRWFPEVSDNLAHHTMALAGEVGEFANLVKKIERGSLNIQDAAVRLQLRNEATDIYIYLLTVCGIINVDVSQAYPIVRAQNEKRFGTTNNNNKGVKK